MTHTHTHTHTHMNTMTRPGLRAGPSENSPIIQKSPKIQKSPIIKKKILNLINTTGRNAEIQMTGYRNTSDKLHKNKTLKFRNTNYIDVKYKL